MKKCLVTCSALFAGIAGFAAQYTLTVGGDGVTCAPAGGTYESGASVSVSAGEGFVKWLGDVPAGSESNATIAVTMDSDKKLVPVYDGMWVLERAPGAVNGTITEVTSPREGHVNWVLNTFRFDDAKHTFSVGTNGWTAGNGFRFENGQMIGDGKLDLSTKIVDAAGDDWTLTHLNHSCLRVPATNPALTEFIAPKTLLTIGEQVFNCQAYGGSVLTNFVMDCPNLTGKLGNHSFTGNTSLDHMTLKLPGITLMERAVVNGPTLKSTDVSDWDLSGLKELQGFLRTEGSTGGWVSYAESGFFAAKKCTGVLNLPSVEIVGTNAFSGSQLDEIRLGTVHNRSVKSIGVEAFANQWMITGGAGGTWIPSTKFETKKIVIAGEPGWTLAPDSISLNGGLSQIVFLGALPQPLGEGETFFSSPDAAAKKVCFYVNEYDAAGARALAQARELTAGEADDFMQSNPGAAAPVGVVSGEVFGTAYEQFIGKVDFAEYGLIGLVKADVYDDRYGDSVEIEIEGGKPADEAAPGDRVTLRAVLNEGNRIGYWRGLPEDAVVNGNEVSFVLKDRPVDICLRVQHKWRWLAAGSEENPTTTNRVTDGVWQLNVYDNGNAAKKQITVGRAWRWGTAYTGIGSGTLDLNGPVEKDGDTGWSIAGIAQASFKTKSSATEKELASGNIPMPNVVTEFIAPTNLTTSSLGDLLSNVAGTAVLTNVVLYIPEMSGDLGGWMLSSQTELRNLELYAPKATSFGEGPFNSTLKLVSDVGTWRLDSIGSIARMIVSGSSNLYGDLRLPSLTNVTVASGMSNFKISSLELGTKYEPKDQMPLMLSATCFAGCSKLERLVVGPYARAEFASDSFAGVTALREVVFEDRPFARAELDKMLAGAADLAVAIYGSPLRGWTRENLQLTQPTAEELERLPSGVDARLVSGVYATAGGKRAWVVRRASEWDPKGTVLVVR